MLLDLIKRLRLRFRSEEKNQNILSELNIGGEPERWDFDDEEFKQIEWKDGEPIDLGYVYVCFDYDPEEHVATGFTPLSELEQLRYSVQHDSEEIGLPDLERFAKEAGQEEDLEGLFDSMIVEADEEQDDENGEGQ